MTENSRLIEFRKALNLTQSNLGKKVGVKDNTVSTYEKGTRPIPDYVKISLHHQFNLNINWLETGQGQMFIINKSSNELHQTITAGLNYLQKAKNKFEQLQKLLKNK